MTADRPNQSAQLERIAQLLGRSSQDFTTDSQGLIHLIGLIEVWPRLTDEDRRDVLMFAAERAARREEPKSSRR